MLLPTYADRRAALAAMAARRALAGAGPQAVWAPLARLTAAELLCPAAPPAAADLADELAALCAAADAAVRRRSGWLRAALPTAPLPVTVRPPLLQAAVLCVLAGALRAGAPALVRCMPRDGAALLVLRGGQRGMAGPAPALLRRLAAESGGTAVFLAGAAGAPFAATLRLPPAAGKAKPARPAEDLLADRYSLLYQFLGPFCAGPF